MTLGGGKTLRPNHFSVHGAGGVGLAGATTRGILGRAGVFGGFGLIRLGVVVHMEAGSFKDDSNGKEHLAHRPFAGRASGQRRIARFLDQFRLLIALLTFVNVGWHFIPSKRLRF